MLSRTREQMEADTLRDLKEWDHFAKWCYADKKTCISCGCYPPKGMACPSHSGSDRYKNYLKEKELTLLERQVLATEKLAGINAPIAQSAEASVSKAE